MSRFFSTLNYSSCNEDWRTERAALRIGPGDSVLCVTGSGARPLQLLLEDPRRIVAIDANPAQTHLLELKIAAMRALPYPRYAGFLGLLPAPDRRDLYQRVAAGLPAAARAFWDGQPRLVERGVIYQGRWERYWRRLSSLVRLLRGRSVAALFAQSDLEEQRRFVRDRWDGLVWRGLVRFLSAPWLSRLLLGDPAFYEHVDGELRVGRYLHQRMLDCLDRNLARSSFMLSLILRGVLSFDDLPPDLAPEPVATIRERLDAVERRTEDAIRHLEQAPAGSYSRFSLSDLPSYLDAQGFQQLLEALIRAAAPGARFCIRQFLTRYPIPGALSPWLCREPGLEARLELEDRSFAYTFMVGTVQTRGRA